MNSTYSEKRSDVIWNIFEYFIVLDCYVKTLQVKTVESHLIVLDMNRTSSANQIMNRT